MLDICDTGVNMHSINRPEYRYLKKMFELKIAIGHRYIIKGLPPTDKLEEVMEAIENNYSLLELSP